MKKKIIVNWKAYTGGALMSVIIGLQYIFIKNILAIFGENIFLLLAIRFLLSLIPFLFFIHKIHFALIFKRSIILFSLIQPFFNLILQTYGVKMLNVTTVGYLTSLNPIFNIAASLIFLKEKITRKQFYYILLAVAGCILASSADASEASISVLGILLIIGSLIFRSLYSVKSKDLCEKYSVLDLTFSQLIWGFILFGLSSLVSGQVMHINQIAQMMSRDDYIGLIYLSIMSLSAAYYLNNYVISKITVITTGVLNNLTFFVTVFSGVFFRKEAIPFLSVIGSVMILAGIIMTAVQRSKMEGT